MYWKGISEIMEVVCTLYTLRVWVCDNCEMKLKQKTLGFWVGCIMLDRVSSATIRKALYYDGGLVLQQGRGRLSVTVTNCSYNEGLVF